MCIDHMILYECDHIRLVETEPCLYYNEDRETCTLKEPKKSWHFPKFDCRECRSKKAKATRNKRREEKGAGARSEGKG